MVHKVMDCMDFGARHMDVLVGFLQILVNRNRVVDRSHGDNHCWDHMDSEYIRHLQGLEGKNLISIEISNLFKTHTAIFEWISSETFRTEAYRIATVQFTECTNC